MFSQQDLNEMMYTCFANDTHGPTSHFIPRPSLLTRGGVLLLGSTGLNGAHVLRYLVKLEHAKVGLE